MAKKEKVAGIDLHGCSVSAIVEKLNNKYGANTLALASKALGISIEFFSTGIYELDAAMGGGIPKNRMTELRGPFSSLKTTIIHTGEANFQQTHKKGLVFHIDVEKTLDVDYVKRLGCDLSRFVIVNPDSGEQAIDVLNDVLGTDVDVLVAVDSIAALVPTAELEGSMDNQFMGLHPRLIGRMMRTANSKMKRSLYTRGAPSTTIIAANQLREKLGIMFGNPETTPGGRAKDFYYSMMVRVASTASDKLMRKVKIGGVERNIMFGQKVRFTVSKNKCGGEQYVEGEFEYYKKRFKHYLPFSFNNDDFLFRYGMFFKIIKEKNGKFVYEDVSGGKEHIFIENLSQDEDARQLLLEEIMEKVIKENSGETDADIEFTESEEVEVVPKKKKLSFKKK